MPNDDNEFTVEDILNARQSLTERAKAVFQEILQREEALKAEHYEVLLGMVNDRLVEIFNLSEIELADITYIHQKPLGSRATAVFKLDGIWFRAQLNGPVDNPFVQISATKSDTYFGPTQPTWQSISSLESLGRMLGS